MILAAGASSRMGRPKALLPTTAPGETFVGRLVETLAAAGVDDIVVVSRPGLELADAVGRHRARPRVIENPEPAQGQLSSLQIALDVVDRPGLDGMLVTIVDLPLVSVETVRRLLSAFASGPGRIVRPARGDSHGHPVIFARALFAEIRTADRAVGAKAVLRAHAQEIIDVPVDDPGAFEDIDTPEDYAAVFGTLPPG